MLPNERGRWRGGDAHWIPTTGASPAPPVASGPTPPPCSASPATTSSWRSAGAASASSTGPSSPIWPGSWPSRSCRRAPSTSGPATASTASAGCSACSAPTRTSSRCSSRATPTVGARTSSWSSCRAGRSPTRIETMGAMSWPEVLDVGVKVSGALHNAHLAGVLHRDLKPDNILVSAFGEPALADFGIAAVTGQRQPDGQPHGQRGLRRARGARGQARHAGRRRVLVRRHAVHAPRRSRPALAGDRRVGDPGRHADPHRTPARPPRPRDPGDGVRGRGAGAGQATRRSLRLGGGAGPGAAGRPTGARPDADAPGVQPDRARPIGLGSGRPGGRHEHAHPERRPGRAAVARSRAGRRRARRADARHADTGAPGVPGAGWPQSGQRSGAGGHPGPAPAVRRPGHRGQRRPTGPPRSRRPRPGSTTAHAAAGGP